jgi:predicted RNase H-like HicB family nuclease
MTEGRYWGEYIDAAMSMATYKVYDDDDGSYYGEIPGLQGVWANADTLTECQEELREVLEGWIDLGIELGHSIPDIQTITRMPKEEIV